MARERVGPEPDYSLPRVASPAMGGAERDIIRNLPALSKKFEVSVATLDSALQLDSICEEYGIKLMKPDIYWKPPQGLYLGY